MASYSQVVLKKESKSETPTHPRTRKLTLSNWLSIIKVFDASNHLDNKIALK